MAFLIQLSCSRELKLTLIFLGLDFTFIHAQLASKAQKRTFLGSTVRAEEFVICPGSPARTIKCDAPDEVIDVDAAQLVLADDTNHCTDPNIDIIGRIESGEGITCKEELPFTK